MENNIDNLKQVAPENKKNIYQRLNEIQMLLKSPKQKEGTYTFPYRTSEDILEKIKEHLSNDLLITMNHEVVLIGDRYYIKATACLMDTTGENKIERQAFAREPLQRKSCDESQTTGATSSYASKYALCNLFAIDDSKKDPDSKSNSKVAEAEGVNKEFSPPVFKQKFTPQTQNTQEDNNVEKGIFTVDSFNTQELESKQGKKYKKAILNSKEGVVFSSIDYKLIPIIQCLKQNEQVEISFELSDFKTKTIKTIELLKKVKQENRKQSIDYIIDSSNDDPIDDYGTFNDGYRG